MAYIILPSRRTRQPQGPVRIDWSNPLARGLASFVSGSGYGSGLVQSTSPKTASQVGLANTFSGSQYARVTDGPVDHTGQVSFFAIAKCTNNTATNTLVSARVAGAADYFALDLSGTEPSDPLRLVTSFGGSYALTYADNPPYNAWTSYGCAKVTALVSMLYVGGVSQSVRYANSGSPTGGTVYPGACIGALEANGTFTNYFNGDIAFGGIWNRLLTAQEFAALHANPWQIFAPDSRRIYFGASGSGANIFESTFATSWSLSEAYSTSATLVSTYADSPTVTDSSSSSAVFSSAFDETVPVSDGPSADMGGVANRTQEESFTITDAYSASMVANATISETLSAEASASAAAIFNATFAETLPIVDGEEADAGRISDIAENATVTDAYTAGIVAQATQAESVTTIDTYDTIAIYNPLLAETLPITDTVGATLTVPTSGTVDLSQESIDSLAHEIMVQLTSTPVRKL